MPSVIPKRDGDLVFINTLPSSDTLEENIDFHASSFFQPSPIPFSELPTPSSVLERNPKRGYVIVKFEELNLVVKYGGRSYLRLEEAQTMQAIKTAFPNHDIPVPEVFGWRKHRDKYFLHMSLIRGQTLREAWSSLTMTEKESIFGELSHIVVLLRRLTPIDNNKFIGSINGGAIQDRLFRHGYEKGPFLSIKSFNDWFLNAAIRQSPESEVVSGPYRDHLPDSGDIYFTHGDLTLNNIIVSGQRGSRNIAGIIDWEQAGWYPEYWEYCKMLYAVEDCHEWREAGWVNKVMKSYDEECFAFAEYSQWICP